jgi:hypothetical protein
MFIKNRNDITKAWAKFHNSIDLSAAIHIMTNRRLRVVAVLIHKCYKSKQECASPVITWLNAQASAMKKIVYTV